MEKVRDSFWYILLAAGGVLELLLLAALGNEYRNQGHEFGIWGLRMGDDTATAISWLAVILVGMSFIAFWARLKFAAMLAIIGAAVLVELLWGNDLPSPQDEWGYGLAFLLGALAMFIQAVRRTDFLDRARESFGKLWGG